MTNLSSNRSSWKTFSRCDLRMLRSATSKKTEVKKNKKGGSIPFFKLKSGFVVVCCCFLSSVRKKIESGKGDLLIPENGRLGSDQRCFANSTTDHHFRCLLCDSYCSHKHRTIEKKKEDEERKRKKKGWVVMQGGVGLRKEGRVEEKGVGTSSVGFYSSSISISCFLISSEVRNKKVDNDR